LPGGLLREGLWHGGPQIDTEGDRHRRRFRHRRRDTEGAVDEIDTEGASWQHTADDIEAVSPPPAAGAAASPPSPAGKGGKPTGKATKKSS